MAVVLIGEGDDETLRLTSSPIHSKGTISIFSLYPLLIFHFSGSFEFILWIELQRGLHSRNKKAAEYIAKGWSATKEVERVIDYAAPKDPLLIPLLRV